MWKLQYTTKTKLLSGYAIRSQQILSSFNELQAVKQDIHNSNARFCDITFQRGLIRLNQFVLFTDATFLLKSFANGPWLHENTYKIFKQWTLSHQVKQLYEIQINSHKALGKRIGLIFVKINHTLNSFDATKAELIALRLNMGLV